MRPCFLKVGSLVPVSYCRLRLTPGTPASSLAGTKQPSFERRAVGLHCARGLLRQNFSQLADLLCSQAIGQRLDGSDVLQSDPR